MIKAQMINQMTDAFNLLLERLDKIIIFLNERGVEYSSQKPETKSLGVWRQRFSLGEAAPHEQQR
jgi:hypothetical protein